MLELILTEGVFATGMASQTLSRSTAELQTERVDAVECLDNRLRHQARSVRPAEPGRYIEVQGRDQTLLIPVRGEVIHIGRGLAADLRLH